MADTAVSKRPALAAPLVQTMQGVMPHIPSLLPKDISTEQFRAALYLELAGNQSLGDCTPESVRSCVIKAATYGLLPGRDVYFIPYGSKRGGRREATYVPSYFGIILAMERTGKIRRAFAHPVHEGDEYSFDMFQDHPLHRPAVTLGKQPGKELFYYGAVMFKDGTCAFEVVTLEDLDAVRRRAPAHDGGPWATDRVMMCRKTALKRVAKYIRLTPEYRELLAEDAEREQDDIPAERHRQNVVDLFGPGSDPTAYAPPPPAAPPQHVEPANPLMGRIEDELTKIGYSYEEREAWWERMGAKYPDLTEPVTLALLYDDLLAEGTKKSPQAAPGATTTPPAPRSEEADTIDFFGSEGA